MKHGEGIVLAVNPLCTLHDLHYRELNRCRLAFRLTERGGPAPPPHRPARWEKGAHRRPRRCRPPGAPSLLVQHRALAPRFCPPNALAPLIFRPPTNQMPPWATDLVHLGPRAEEGKRRVTMIFPCAEREKHSKLDEEAVLIKRNGRRRPMTHRAALGLLLNRVKRMRVPPGTTIEIVCGA